MSKTIKLSPSEAEFDSTCLSSGSLNLLPGRLGTNSIFFHFISDFSAIFFLPSYGRWPGTGRKLSDYCPSGRSQHVNFKLNLYFCFSCHCSPLLLFPRFGSQICQEFAPSATTPEQVPPYSAHEIKKTRRGNQFSHLNFPLGVSLRLFKISRCPYVRVCCCSRLGTGWWFVSSDSVLSKGFGSHRLVASRISQKVVRAGYNFAMSFGRITVSDNKYDLI